MGHGYDFRKMTIDDVRKIGRIKGESPLRRISANGTASVAEAAARAIEGARITGAEVPAKPIKMAKARRKGKMLSISIFLPIRIHSEANEHQHWSKKAKRAAAQAQEFEVEWYRLTKNARIELPCLVRFTRIGQKRMDDDNLANGFKRLRDALAKALGVDDGGELIRFEYQQEATGKREYGVRVEVVSLCQS